MSLRDSPSIEDKQLWCWRAKHKTQVDFQDVVLSKREGVIFAAVCWHVCAVGVDVIVSKLPWGPRQSVVYLATPPPVSFF